MFCSRPLFTLLILVPQLQAFSVDIQITPHIFNQNYLYLGEDYTFKCQLQNEWDGGSLDVAYTWELKVDGSVRPLTGDGIEAAGNHLYIEAGYFKEGEEAVSVECEARAVGETASKLKEY